MTQASQTLIRDTYMCNSWKMCDWLNGVSKDMLNTCYYSFVKCMNSTGGCGMVCIYFGFIELHIQISAVSAWILDSTSNLPSVQWSCNKAIMCSAIGAVPQFETLSVHLLQMWKISYLALLLQSHFLHLANNTLTCCKEHSLLFQLSQVYNNLSMLW